MQRSSLAFSQSSLSRRSCASPFGRSCLGVAAVVLSCACGSGPDEGFRTNETGLHPENTQPAVLDSAVHGSADVSCTDNDLLTTLGWATPSDQHQLGEVYLAALDYEGDEPCIALRYDSQLLGTAPPGSDRASGPLTASVSHGLEVEFSEDVPLDAREAARAELIDSAAFRFDGTRVSWLDPPAGGHWLDPYGAGDAESEGYAQAYRLRNATFYPFDQFVFIVTRRYAVEHVSTPEGNVDTLGTLRYPGVELATSYDCPMLPLGDVGATFYDGVFMDATEGFAAVVARTDLPRRFCPEIPGSARPPGNGALTPPAPQ
jgi:hypothetical protein